VQFERRTEASAQARLLRPDTVEVSEQWRATAGGGMEERRPIKENIRRPTAPRTQSRIGELSGLLDVRKVARKKDGHGSLRCSTT